ncbi:MAG: two-component regulator propeller domain-containing protein [Anaerolineales bacterium]
MQFRKELGPQVLILLLAFLLAGCSSAETNQAPSATQDTLPAAHGTSSPTTTQQPLPADLETPASTPVLFAEDQTGITAFQLRPAGIVSYVWTIAVADDGSLWFGGAMGAVQFDAKTWTIYGVDEGLPKDNVQAIVVDEDGALWFATLGGGVSRFKERAWKYYTTLNGLVDDSVTCAYVASNGDIWFGTYGGVSRFDGENWQSYTRINGLPDDTVNAITETSDGTIWFGTNRGLSRFDGYRWLYYGVEQGLRGGLVRALAVTADGTLWVGTHGTLNRFDGESWSYITQDDGLADPRIDALYGATDGSLWVGSIGGISRWIDGRWINYSQDNELQLYDINAIREGPDGSIWIAGGYNQIYSFHPPAKSDDPVTMKRAANQLFSRPILPKTDGQELVIERIEMIDAQAGWAVGGAGAHHDHILRTNDGGVTWRDVSPPAVRSLLIFPARTGVFFYDRNNAWIVYNDGAELWSTSNGGQTWTSTQIDYPQSRSDRLYFSDPNRGWLLRHVESGMGNEYVALYRTSDGGLSWDKLIDPYEDQDLQGCMKTGMVFHEDRGWITYDCQGVYRQALIDWTEDRGETWQPIWLPLPQAEAEDEDSYCTTKNPYLFSSTQGALLVECYHFSGTLKTTERFLYLTSDAGSTWNVNDFPGATLLFIDEQTVFALGQEISLSLNQGRDWTDVKSVQWQGQFSFVDENLGWAVATYEDEIALVYTLNGGRSWLEIKPTLSEE